MHGFKTVSAVLSGLGLLIVILDGKTALLGAGDGIDLCLKTVIPALFPFFLLSSALLRSIPSGSHSRAALLIPCFLGGYPVGARSVHQAYIDGYLKREEAERMLAYSNNAGPAFLFGMLGPLFPQAWMPWALWAFHIAGAAFAAQWVSVPTAFGSGVSHSSQTGKDLMSSAVSTMGVVCGWIIFFRVLIAFLDRWFFWFFPPAIRTALIGLLELSNGCCELVHIDSISVRFLLCSGMLSMGGLCVIAQTVSVTQGLSLRFFFLGKCIQSLVCLLLSFSLMQKTTLPLLLLLPIILYPRIKNRGRKPAAPGV